MLSLLVIVMALFVVSIVDSACPTSSSQFPQLETQPESLGALDGIWLDEFSSREADTHFYCTQQANAQLNATSYRTDTTSFMAQGKLPYAASFINVGVAQQGSELVFELVPASRSAHWFAGSLFFLVDYQPDAYYAWMICNDSDEYEFHISARQGAKLDGIPDRVLGILDDYGLNPQGQTFHEEPHPVDVCST